MSGQQSLLACSSRKHYKRNERWLLIASWFFVSTDMGTIHVFHHVLQCRKGKTKNSSRKNVNQTRGLIWKNGLISTVKMLFISVEHKQKPADPSCTQTHTGCLFYKYTHGRTNTDTLALSLSLSLSLSRTHSYMYDGHTWYYIAVGIKSALTSNVSVMHTVGPDSDIIYKPNH